MGRLLLSSRDGKALHKEMGSMKLLNDANIALVELGALQLLPQLMTFKYIFSCVRFL